jgi:transposase-like protein
MYISFLHHTHYTYLVACANWDKCQFRVYYKSVDPGTIQSTCRKLEVAGRNLWLRWRSLASSKAANLETETKMLAEKRTTTNKPSRYLTGEHDL